MNKSYTPEEKRRIDAILAAFSDYIASLQNIDILYSPKMGLYVIIYPQFDHEELDAHALYHVDDVLFDLFILLTSKAEAVRREQGSGMNAKELEECQHKIAPILARLQGDDRVYCENAWAEFLSDMEDNDALDHLLYDAFQSLTDEILAPVIQKEKELFGDSFCDADRLLLEWIYQRFLLDPDLEKFRQQAKEMSSENFIHFAFPDKFLTVAVEYSANHDALTKLLSERTFYQTVAETMAAELFRALRKGSIVNDILHDMPSPPQQAATRVRYTGESCVSLTNGKEYNVIADESGWYRIIDDTDEDYLFDPIDFEIIEE